MDVEMNGCTVVAILLGPMEILSLEDEIKSSSKYTNINLGGVAMFLGKPVMCCTTPGINVAIEPSEAIRLLSTWK